MHAHNPGFGKSCSDSMLIVDGIDLIGHRLSDEPFPRDGLHSASLDISGLLTKNSSMHTTLPSDV